MQMCNIKKPYKVCDQTLLFCCSDSVLTQQQVVRISVNCAAAKKCVTVSGR